MEDCRTLVFIDRSDRPSKTHEMGGAECFEHVQKPATAIQGHVSSPSGIYKVKQACTFETKTLGLISIQTVWHLNFVFVEKKIETVYFENTSK